MGIKQTIRAAVDAVTGGGGAAGPLAGVERPPAPLPLDSFEEYVKARDRVAELEARRLRGEARIAEIDRLLWERDSHMRLAVDRLLKGHDAADRLLAGEEPAEGAYTVTLVQELRDEREAIVRELRVLREAVERGRQLVNTSLPAKFAKQRGAPLKEWHKGYVAECARRAVELAKLWTLECDLVEELIDRHGIPCSAMCEFGPCRPPFAKPGQVANWIAWLMNIGMLPNTPEWREAREMETPAVIGR